MTAAIVVAALNGWTRLDDLDIRERWLWFAISVALMVLLHDAYFYWTHLSVQAATAEMAPSKFESRPRGCRASL